MRALCLTAALLVAAGCAYDGIGPAPLPPEIEVSTVAPNPHNVLSAVVTARGRFADSVAVRYGLAGEALASATPAVAPVDDSVVVPVLGLLAETAYTLQVTGPTAYSVGILATARRAWSGEPVTSRPSVRP